MQCTDLTENQFEIFKKDKSFEWFCEKCASNVCKKCNIITTDDVRIQCQKCENKYHLRCVGLSKTAFIPTTLWYCYLCLDEIFPYNSIPVKQICNLAFNSNNLDRHPNQFRSIHRVNPNSGPPVFNTRCNVCQKIVHKVDSAIPCPCCMCLIHQSCSKLKNKEIQDHKNNRNAWECPTCYSDKFPFMLADDVDLHMLTFNSNWKCQCKTKTPKFLPSPVSNEYKLILNRYESNDKADLYLEDFDENFDLYHSLKPDFKYYETHDFHTMKDGVKNTFSVFHTNIRSLPYNGENLHNLLASLEFKFDVVALSETWNPEHKKHSFCPPILPGYNKYKGTTGSSMKGGCGMYINSELKPLPRPDLNIKVKEVDIELETYWTEIILDKQPNRLIGVIYRHPTKINNDKCIDFMNETQA